MINQKYEAYKGLMQKIKDIEYAVALLHWDMETYMPAKGANFRSQQMATLQALAHELFIEDSTGVLLQELLAEKESLDAEQLANIQLSLEDYEKATKLPIEFVKESSVIRTEAFQAWLKAREAKDYEIFRPALSRMIDNKREEARLLGYVGHPYNALLDQYEKGAVVEKLDILFKVVREKLVIFVKELHEKGKTSPKHFLEHHFPKAAQWDLGLYLLKQMGYDFEAGRQDISAHPFTTNFSPEDVRVTTRVDEKDLMSMIGSCIHEGGHALYEQGLPTEQYGLPLGSATSLGIHESQSRLWENNVALSLAYWKANFLKLQSDFPSQFSGISTQDYYKAINQVKPNLIRIEADELHYHLHVLIRYELEKGLMDGSISTDNLNKVWNDRYKEYMGVEVADDKEGVLQDIHWSQGLVGYFPTYSLGSFYAAQFFNQARKEIPNLILEIEKGNMKPLLDWLREKIHRYGRRYTSEELCEQITGEGLNLKYFMDYAEAKYREIYSI
jgi:carboxypeptidase Taq